MKDNTNICSSCEHNEDEFCLAELESCENINSKRGCYQYINKDIRWCDTDHYFCKRNVGAYDNYINIQLKKLKMIGGD